MKKKIMSVILSSVLVSGMGIPMSVYGEDFISGETAEETTAEPDAVPTDVVPDNENGEASWEDAGDVQEDSTLGFGDGETEEVSPEASILTDGNAENDVVEDEIEEGTVDIDSFDAETSWFDKAQGIAVNTTYTTSFTDTTKERWYKITVPNDGAIGVTFEHAYIESDRVYWKMEFYNSGNHEKISAYSFAGNKISYSQQRFGVAAGTYYVKLYDDWYTDINFNFRINYEVTNSWEKEYNDTYQIASDVNLNEQYYGALQYSDDVDWYKFTLPQDGYISMDFTHNYVEMDRRYWRIDLYNSLYSRLEKYDIGGKKVTYNSSQIGLPAGTYYLKIYNDWYCDLEYGLKVNYTASNVWEKEFNDSYDSATPITLNTTYYGSEQQERADADWFVFKAPVAGSYEFSFSHDYLETYETKYWNIEIYDSTFKRLVDWKYYIQDQFKSDKVELPAGGTYYIKISDHYTDGMTYAFKLTSHTHSYTTQVTKATLTQDGTITKKCSCGYVGEKTTIYHPDTVILSTTSYTYDGKSHKPQVTVYDSKSNVISSGNYTLSYGSNTKSIGDHYITIQFTGNYSGTASSRYTIYPKAPKLTKLSAKSKGFTAKWGKLSSCSGYIVEYSTSKYFSKSKIVTISRKSATSTTVRRLKGKKKYYVRVRSYKIASGYKYYSSWSNIKSVKTKR